MNGGDVRPGRVSAAAVLIGGAVALVFPQHAWSLLQLVIVTIPVAIGLHVLASRVPPTGWLSPFKWMSPFAPAPRRARGAHERNELALIRSWLAGWRQRVKGAPPLPPATLTLLKPLIGRALELDPHETHPAETARARVSPLTWAVLTTEPRKGLRWVVRIPPDHGAVARTVERVLDDLDGLDSQQPHASNPGAP